MLLCEKEIHEIQVPWLAGTWGGNVSMQMLLSLQGQYLAQSVHLLEAKGVDPIHPDLMKTMIIMKGNLLDAFPLLFLV